jgi:hypothetical protein
MKSRANPFVLAAVAGCACAAASAQSSPAGALRFGGYVTPVALQINGVPYPVQAGGSDDNQLIYENGTVGTPAAFGTTSVPKWHMLDQASFTPGPGAGSGQLINGMQFALGFGAAVTMPNAPVDVVVQFWDTLNTAATPVTSDSRGMFRVTFNPPATGWAINTYYLANMIDLSAQPGGGFQTTDDLVFVDIAYLIMGGEIPAGAHPDCSGTFADFTAGIINTVGSSPPTTPNPTYWRDVSGNGMFEPGEERIFAAPAAANFIMTLQANVGAPATCYPDCNQDHALNVNDFVCFQTAFAGGNLPQADCNTDQVLNVLDFVCFQSAFAAGCSQL